MKNTRQSNNTGFISTLISIGEDFQQRVALRSLPISDVHCYFSQDDTLPPDLPGWLPIAFTPESNQKIFTKDIIKTIDNSEAIYFLLGKNSINNQNTADTIIQQCITKSNNQPIFILDTRADQASLETLQEIQSTNRRILITTNPELETKNLSELDTIQSWLSTTLFSVLYQGYIGVDINDIHHTLSQKTTTPLLMNYHSEKSLSERVNTLIHDHKTKPLVVAINRQVSSGSVFFGEVIASFEENLSEADPIIYCENYLPNQPDAPDLTILSYSFSNVN